MSFSQFAKSEKENTLREASCFGDIEGIDYLIERGIDINAKHPINGWTALHWAANRGNTKVVRLLIDRGADKSVRANDGKRPKDVSVPSMDEINTMLACPDDPDSVSQIAKGKGSSSNSPLDVKAPKFQPSYTATQPVHAPPPTSRPASTSAVVACSQSQLYEMEEKEFVLKVRLWAGSAVGDLDEDGDFYELELPSQQYLTLYELESRARQLLSIPADVCIRKIRKLPNTVIRTDRDVSRLAPFEELEFVV